MKKHLITLFGTLVLAAGLLFTTAAAAGPQLVVGDQAATSQTVGLSDLGSDCQSIQVTFTLSADGVSYDFAPNSAIAGLPGVYTTYRQNGNQVTVYVTVRSGTLTSTGSLELGTLSTVDTPFTVEKATGLKVVDQAGEGVYYPTMDDVTGGNTGGNTGTGGSTGGGGGTGGGNTGGNTGGNQTPGSMPFTDVPEGSWYYEAVGYVYEHGLMSGTGGSLFSPDMTTSRAMIVTILYRLEGSPAVTAANSFGDVAAGQWYTDAVLWANANGIVTGYDNGSFGPEDTITREQMATILFRYASYKGYDVSARADLSGYTDAGQVQPYAAQAMGWVVESGIINGTTATTLSPGGSATRSQAAVILARFCQGLE